jgi:hypothetical protein
MLCAHGRLDDIAAEFGFALGRFLDLLQAPEVQAHLDAADRAQRRRARARLLDAAQSAADTLQIIAEKTDNDPTERRRAATTLLRAIGTGLVDRKRRRADLESRLQRLVDALPQPEEDQPRPPNHAHASDHAPERGAERCPGRSPGSDPAAPHRSPGAGDGDPRTHAHRTANNRQPPITPSPVHEATSDEFDRASTSAPSHAHTREAPARDRSNPISPSTRAGSPARPEPALPQRRAPP